MFNFTPTLQPQPNAPHTMLKLDLLVPVILILCLIALAYILSKVFSSAEQEVQTRPNTEIVLDEDAYRDDQDLGTATNNTDANTPNNVSNSDTDKDDLSEYYQDDSEGTIMNGDDKDDGSIVYYDEETGGADSDANAGSGSASASSTTTTTSPSTTRRAVSSGQYMVITGSFRQKIYAQLQVKELKKDGFSDAYVGITNRGAYAVAVAGNSSSYSAAKKMESQAETLGYYDTFVKRAK